jgi:hypothetical protein
MASSEGSQVSSSMDQLLYISNENEIQKYIENDPSLIYATKDEFLQTLLHLACDVQTRNITLASSLLRIEHILLLC